MHKLLNLGVLISGGGRTLQNLIDRIGDGSLKARVQIVISSHPEAFGLERARRHKIPSVVINRGSFKGKSALGGFSQAITEELGRYELDLVVMAGFNCLYRIPERYEGRVMNIHPALIPSFCGKGYYGEKVHRAVLEYGAKVTGCTVHFADNSYDHGPIILQRKVDVLDSDTPESLAERVFEEECDAYPEAISLFQKGLLKIEGRKVRILLPPITPPPEVKVKKPTKRELSPVGRAYKKIISFIDSQVWKLKRGETYSDTPENLMRRAGVEITVPGVRANIRSRVIAHYVDLKHNSIRAVEYKGVVYINVYPSYDEVPEEFKGIKGER